MRQAIRTAVLLGLAFLSSISLAQTIVLVRHAEKVSEAPDALLSDAGKQRAERLARTLTDAGITAIFTTEFERTKQTAAPTAKAIRLDVTVIPGKDVSGLVSKLLALPKSAVVLVVGHSNTLPAIIEKLMAGPGNSSPSPTTITTNDVDYDKLFIITLDHSKEGEGMRSRPKLLILHY